MVHPCNTKTDTTTIPNGIKPINNKTAATRKSVVTNKYLGGGNKLDQGFITFVYEVSSKGDVQIAQNVGEPRH